VSPEERIKAEIQVELFIELLAKRYGLKDDDIPEFVNNVRWLANHRRRVDRITWTAVLAIISLGATGATLAMWEGIKHYIGKVP
jgi:hypothetical protein